MKRVSANSSRKARRWSLRERGKSFLRREERERSRRESGGKDEVHLSLLPELPCWKSSMRDSHSCGERVFFGGLSMSVDWRGVGEVLVAMTQSAMDAVLSAP